MKPRIHLWLIAAIIVLFPLALLAQAGPGMSAFSITRSATDGIQIHFELPQWSLESAQRNGETLQRVTIDGAQYLFIDEEETLPVFATMIAIPYSGGVSLRQLGSGMQTQDQVKLDFDASLTSERSGGRYSDALYPAANALISQPQVLRDFRVVTVNIYPFQYDQESKQLIVRESMDIRLDFNTYPSINEIAPPLGYSSAFEQIYRGLILNYEQMLDRDVSYTSPRMLVIYGNLVNTTYQDKVDEYVAWKKQKGYLVTAVSTATAGTTNTAIKTFIQNQYNNVATRPDYIVIIGDDSGTIAVPTFSTYIDYEYTWLAGGDILGDVIIGRISVNETQKLIDYMGKIRSLERDINLNTASWLNRMLLVGDSASSGISTIYTNEYIHDHSLAVNPSYTYTELYGGSPSTTNINAAINMGVAFYNYRGWLGMSNWPSTMGNMSNGSKLFHAVFITCSTGSWGGGTSTTETVVRYGTEATMGGAVTAIGMATSYTHTPMNNCLNVGIFHGIYPLGMRDMGAAMLYGKLYLNAIYGVSNAAQARNFAAYCNLIGDPTAEVYVGIPASFSVSAPATISAGTPNLEVMVFDSNSQPVEGASVALTNASGAQYLAFSDASGRAFLSIANTLSGSQTLTVNKHDFKPTIQTIGIDSTGGAVYNSQTIEDTDSGNGDGVANSGEAIELYVNLRNTTTTSLTLTGTVTSSDPYVNLIESEAIVFSTIAPGNIGHNLNPIVLEIAPNCPDQHRIVLSLEVEGSLDRWTVLVPIVVASGALHMQSHSFVGAPGNIINPGDQHPLTISLINSGHADLAGINARLRSRDLFFAVVDSVGYYGSLAQGATASNGTDTFTVLARGNSVAGMTIPLSLYLFNNTGYEETIPITLTIGQTTVTDPLGQDAYGYFIFDEGDISYDQCPTYQWIGIAPAENGSGTALNLTDPRLSGDEGDQVGAVAIQTVTLPFSFKFYGVDYTRASISSNGFIAFGETSDADWRNWRMPDAGGPSPMIAVFWDDLFIDPGTSYVYTYYNAALHYYIVEWYQMISGYDGSTQQTFQAILYDPLYYPTHTGDGQIKLQYKEFHNIDLGTGDTYPHGNFCTIGIEDHTETIGLEYTFGNIYPTAAAPLSNESALLITTRPFLPDHPYIAIEQVVIYDANANNHLEAGETAGLSIRLGNHGLVGATGVSAVLSSTDPYVTITTASAYYGSIAAQGYAYPQTNYTISVAANCPADHIIPFTLAITGDNGSWSDILALTVYVPELGFSNMVVNDNSGNQNGILDPGETATLTIHLNNSGEIPSLAGTASLSCSTPGISITNGTDTFPALAAGAHEILVFVISASAGMTDGTLVQLNFNATAGTVTANATQYLEVGAPLVVVIGNGTSTQAYPLDRYYNYSAHEAIYLASEIAMAGTLKSLAFYKASGSDMNPIAAVTIYLKNTTASTLASGNYSTAGYTQVFNGSYPNNATSGWMEVNLNPMFVYDGVSNLSILTIKGNEQWISNYPYWTYTTTPTNRARHNHSDYDAPMDLMANTSLPNIRLKVFPEVDLLMPPQNLTASASHQSVALTWSAPAVGSPTGYRIYRNSALLTTVTALSYIDLAVTNGSTYNYYLIAVYSDGTSDPTPTVSATPNAIAPTNLVAIGGNAVVSLSWTAATGREELDVFSAKDRTISSYRIYRNGVILTTVTGTSYEDTNVVNGSTYSYHVTTVYINPAGESAASNTAIATPNILSFVVIGTGTLVTTGPQNSPINICNNSTHGQSVYTAAELNNAGVTGPVLITGMGFNIVTAPALPLPNFLVRIKHTTATNAASWHDATDLVTCYSTASYTPTAGGYDMLQFSTPFEWNGTDNILIDTAFSLVVTASNTGTIQYTEVTNSYRFAWSNTADQTNVFVGGTVRDRRPNIRLTLQAVTTGPEIAVDPASIPFGDVAVNATSSQHFTIENTGDETLTGTITTPTGFSVALVTRESGAQDAGLVRQSSDRNTISVSIPAGQTSTYNLTFAPTAIAAYSGNVVIATNAADAPSVSIAVSGNGIITSLATPVVTITRSGTNAVLAWPAVPNALQYEIYSGTDPLGPYTLLTTITGITYTDTRGLAKAFYYVRAIRN